MTDNQLLTAKIAHLDETTQARIELAREEFNKALSNPNERDFNDESGKIEPPSIYYRKHLKYLLGKVG